MVDTTDSYDEADYQESVQLDEEGCYEVTAQVKDSEGNFTDITLNVYVDGTAPELAQNVIDLDVDASVISIDDINTDDAEKIADMLHELPDFQMRSGRQPVMHFAETMRSATNMSRNLLICRKKTRLKY